MRYNFCGIVPISDNTDKNTYLTHQGRTGPTVPQGSERETIKKAFATLVDEVKTRKTDQGEAMYSMQDQSDSMVDKQQEFALQGENHEQGNISQSKQSGWFGSHDYVGRASTRLESRRAKNLALPKLPETLRESYKSAEIDEAFYATPAAQAYAERLNKRGFYVAYVKNAGSIGGVAFRDDALVIINTDQTSAGILFAQDHEMLHGRTSGARLTPIFVLAAAPRRSSSPSTPTLFTGYAAATPTSAVPSRSRWPSSRS